MDVEGAREKGRKERRRRGIVERQTFDFQRRSVTGLLDDSSNGDGHVSDSAVSEDW